MMRFLKQVTLPEAAGGVIVKNKADTFCQARRLGCGLLVMLFILSGCTSGQPALSKAAGAFKRDALDTINLLMPEFSALLAQNNVQAVSPALAKTIAAADRGGTLSKFRVTILDRKGVKIAGGLQETNDGMNFSGYAAAQTVLQQGEMASDVFYLGTKKVCVICAPLMNEGTVVGAIALAVFEQELKDKWHLTEKEFRDIDF